jgi:hypothetical protein
MSPQGEEGLAARVAACIRTVGEVADIERTVKKLFAGRSYPARSSSPMPHSTRRPRPRLYGTVERVDGLNREPECGLYTR